jgi:HD-GYP domain-containing protein (c-di-GMP phosphodiesterase class II)
MGAMAELIALARKQYFKANPEQIQLKRIHDSPVPGAVAVVDPVFDRRGIRVAQINGIFVLSTETISKFDRGLAVAVLTAVAIVVVTTLMIYPIIRRLTLRLSGLSIQLLDANLETLQVLGNAIAKRDSDTDAHNYRVTIYSVRLAEACAVEDAVIRRLIKGAFLHDVGKIGVRDHILLKPGKLTDEEYEVMKTHVSHGVDIIGQSSWLQDAGELIASHHEQYAGKGYYRGLKGEGIPLTARIFAIADVFDALTSKRPYKKPLTVEESLEILKRGAGEHFDPELLEHFTAIASDLHGRFANDDVAARMEVAEIIQRYFKTDLGIILEEAFTGK